MIRCFGCGAALSCDETALYRRLVNRGAEQFLCLDCLAKKFGVSRAELLAKIEQFRRDGCTLFT